MVQKLSRLQLQQFLPSHEAIKAFEALLDYMGQTSPDNFNEIYISLTDVNARLDALEASIARSVNLAQIHQRLDDIANFLGI